MAEDNVDEVVLSHGAAFYIGGCDKTGHPLVIFPTLHHDSLADIADSDLVTLLRYFKSVAPLQQALNGFSYLINLQKASQQVITKLTTGLNTIQVSSDTLSVHTLYVIKPKTSKHVTLLEKLTGLKPSKKNVTKKTYQVHILKDFASLHRLVDKIALSDEFGGHHQINIPAWVQFRLVDRVGSDIDRCQDMLAECKDEMQISCEIEIPTDQDNTQTLLDIINSKYHKITRELKLEHVIDRCSSALEELNISKGPVKYAQGEMLGDLVKNIRLGQRELTEAREYLQIQWRQAQARVVQASQLRGHQKKANKISKWIDRNGSVTLSGLSVPVVSLKQVATLSQQVKELTTGFQELQRECDYIQTDVEYMALKDLSEFTDSLKSIEKMKSELLDFNNRLVDLTEKFSTAAAVFKNVAKCYNWYCDFVNNLPPSQNQARFNDHCKTCLAKMKNTFPPEEWLDYIEEKLTLVDSSEFCTNTATLIGRLRQINAVILAEDSISFGEFKRWQQSLSLGFDGLTTSGQESPALNVDKSPQQHQTRPKKHVSSTRRSISSTPKLRRTPRNMPDSSTDDLESPQPRARRPTKNRKTSPAKTSHQSSKEGEVYIDLTEHSNITHLPDSLSHIDLTKFLENEPNSDKAGASFTPLNDENEKKGTEARQTTTKKKIHKDVMHTGNEDLYEREDSTAISSKQKSKQSSKQKKIARSHRGDDTDDSCPLVPDHLHYSRSSQPAYKTRNTGADRSSKENLSYNPISHQQRLELIYQRSSSTPQQKLDMMASLIDEADESCFHVEIPQNSFVRRTETTTPTSDVCERSRRIGRLTPANLSRELSEDVNYPDNIYHWLKKQNDQCLTCSPENLDESRMEVKETRELDSMQACIERAEKLLQEDVPSFPPSNIGLGLRPRATDGVSRTPVYPDLVSKSGDSGITELTTKDTHLTNGHRHRYTSKESGLDSEMTGYTITDHSLELQQHPNHDFGGARPREVPPLRLRNSNSKFTSTAQRIKNLKLRHAEEEPES